MLLSLCDLLIWKLVIFLDVSKVEFFNLNLGTIDIWNQLILDRVGLFYTLKVFSIDLCPLDIDSTLHSPALWQPKILPDAIKFPMGSKIIPIWELLHWGTALPPWRDLDDI